MPLRACIFAQGKMVGAQAFLGELTKMVNQITAKNCNNILHIELPTELLKKGGKHQNPPAKEYDNQGNQ